MGGWKEGAGEEGEKWGKRGRAKDLYDEKEEKKRGEIMGIGGGTK